MGWVDQVNEGAAVLLRANPLFGGLPPDALEKLVNLGHSRPTRRGEILYLAGDPGTSLHLIESGEVMITATSESGQELHLNTLGSGAIMGEITVLDGGPRTASARVTEAGRIFTINRSDFLELLDAHPDITLNLMQLLVARLRWISSLLEDSVFLTAPARLAKRLLSIANTVGTETPDGVEIQLTQAELSRFLNLSRQVVNQLLQGLQQEGIVSLGNRKLTILDQPALLKRSLS